MSIQVEVSIGEFLDKLTILQIKSEKIEEKRKLANVNKELETLLDIWQHSPYANSAIEQEVASLRAINEQLWEIEDDIRDKELKKEFDQRFIELARAVYVTNDKRAAIKKMINEKLGSGLVEEKSYADYR